METINDEQLDSLLRLSAHRYETVNSINDAVMKTVKRESRKVKAKKIARLLAFCFGVPLLLLLPAGLFFFVSEQTFSLSTIAIGISLLFFYVPVVRGLNEIMGRGFLE